jgi:hypothetical protein
VDQSGAGTADDTQSDVRKPVELPDFFKELGLDSDSTTGEESIEDLLPRSGESDLPPLRIESDQ